MYALYTYAHDNVPITGFGRHLICHDAVVGNNDELFGASVETGGVAFVRHLDADLTVEVACQLGAVRTLHRQL